ncbi:hypothetical protein Hanom_Chr07g00639831 [Helianthus anomalus]
MDYYAVVSIFISKSLFFQQSSKSANDRLICASEVHQWSVRMKKKESFYYFSERMKDGHMFYKICF